MTNINRFIELKQLSDIPSLGYEGYIWMSDETKPRIDNFDFSKIGRNPFIIEGSLYARKEQISISIKQIDGKYYISQVNLHDLDFNSDNLVHHRYLADSAIVSQNKGYKYLRFVEYWVEEIDELCLKMPVLKPTWIAFIGFCTEGEK